jgi:hypothetical protein
MRARRCWWSCRIWLRKVGNWRAPKLHAGHGAQRESATGPDLPSETPRREYLPAAVTTNTLLAELNGHGGDGTGTRGARSSRAGSFTRRPRTVRLLSLQNSIDWRLSRNWSGVAVDESLCGLVPEMPLEGFFSVFDVFVALARPECGLWEDCFFALASKIHGILG